ncbi:hypothetical protein ACRE_036220 [Hapsidospora chrysogenum ATCC 11550]|uniref:Uncharacterized protein n=1 Tax=Hapsidospora chrysogenum (strain ATCC 11550 / CBS 779.69 / DSM 880 / IAM 14645 / JCM 23072 / IMI 49137) TaxID=857340 RepID=A0A086T873_HAPC1|nr:hypothetical protein ACRE_036220 [Hapsidospora chrysogenum ATCC 11550]
MDQDTRLAPPWSMDAALVGLSKQYESSEQSAVVGELQRLVNDGIDVSNAASAIHGLLTPRSTLYIPSSNDEEPQNQNPNPPEANMVCLRDCRGKANMVFLWDCLGKAAMMVPVRHEGMGRMVCLVHALAKMLPIRVKYALRASGEGKEVMTSLCNLNESDPCSLGKILFRLHELLFIPNPNYEQVTKAKVPEAPSIGLAYSNFMAFAARLYSAGYSETLRLCPLLHVAEFVAHDHWSGELLRYPRPFVSAAAAWIHFAGTELYAMCQSGSPFVNEHLTCRFEMWRWDLWKSRFSHLSRYKRALEEVRSHAKPAEEDMDYIETEWGQREQLCRVPGQLAGPKEDDTPKQDEQEQGTDAVIVNTLCLRAEAEEHDDNDWMIV